MFAGSDKLFQSEEEANSQIENKQDNINPTFNFLKDTEHEHLSSFRFKNPFQMDSSLPGSQMKLQRPPMLQMNLGEMTDSRIDGGFDHFYLGFKNREPAFKEIEVVQNTFENTMKNSCLPFSAKGSVNPLSISIFEQAEQNLNQVNNDQKQKGDSQTEKHQEDDQSNDSNEQLDDFSLDTKNQDNVDKIIEGCKCTNSKCLKLYCICFGQGVHCGEKCKCTICSNKEGFEAEIKEARKNALSRNPNAFTSKVELISTNIVETDKNSGTLGYKRGCKCKKTLCKKKYCECFNAGVKCSYLCICENCLNKEDDKDKQPEKKNKNVRTTTSYNLENEEDESETPVSKRNKNKKQKIDLRDQDESCSTRRMRKESYTSE